VAGSGQWLDDRRRQVQVALVPNSAGGLARRDHVPDCAAQHPGEPHGREPVADYALIALAALFARPTGATAHGPYKMPLWPLPPILALASLGYIFTQQTSLLLKVTLITIAIGLVYWAVIILPQRGRAWNLRQAAIDEEHPA